MKNKKKISASEQRTLWGSRVVIWITMIVVLFPVIWIVMSSFSAGDSFFLSSLFPEKFSIEHYVELFRETDFGIWVFNSLKFCFIVAIIQLVLTSLAAYAFARLRFVGRKYGLMALLILQVFPNSMAVAGYYILIYKFGLVDNSFALILVLAGGSAYNIWLLKSYIDGLPVELDEAAMVDGANEFQVFYKIIIPLAMPQLAVIFLFSFIATYSEYVITSIFLQTPGKMTLALGLQSFISDQFAAHWTLFAAAAVISSLPIMIIFMCLQRFIQNGLVAGGVKGSNEISSGILHEDGKIGTNEDFSGLAGLLESAISGVRASAASSTKIMLHLDQGGKNQLYTWYFGGLLKESPNLDFDVFGLSYYPMWHGTMEGLQYNLNYLATTYNKEVCVVETAYAWTTEDGEGNVFISGDEEVGGYPATVEGQFEFMNDLESIILNVPDDKGIGYFYWEPEWIPVEGGTYATSAGVAYKNDTVTPSNTWDNMTLFNFQGNALDSIKVLNKPCENLLTNISFEQNGITTSPSGWNVWTSDSSDENTVRTEYGDAYDGDYKLTFWDDKEYSCSVYKTYTNIPNGTYKFSIWAKTNGKQDVLQLYAKNYGGSELDTTIETSDINWNIFSIDKIVVTNHTLEIGVYSVAGANDWCNLDLAMLRKID